MGCSKAGVEKDNSSIAMVKIRLKLASICIYKNSVDNLYFEKALEKHFIRGDPEMKTN